MSSPRHERHERSHSERRSSRHERREKKSKKSRGRRKGFGFGAFIIVCVAIGVLMPTYVHEHLCCGCWTGKDGDSKADKKRSKKHKKSRKEDDSDEEGDSDGGGDDDVSSTGKNHFVNYFANFFSAGKQYFFPFGPPNSMPEINRDANKSEEEAYEAYYATDTEEMLLADNTNGNTHYSSTGVIYTGANSESNANAIPTNKKSGSMASSGSFLAKRDTANGEYQVAEGKNSGSTGCILATVGLSVVCLSLIGTILYCFACSTAYTTVPGQDRERRETAGRSDVPVDGPRSQHGASEDGHHGHYPEDFGLEERPP